MMMKIWYVNFCIIKFSILISYQNQEAIVTNNILLSILYPVSYPPAGQPFLETDIQYSNLGMLTVVYPHYHALYFDYEKLRFSWIHYPKFDICCL